MTNLFKITLGLSAAALALGTTAYAQDADGPPDGPPGMMAHGAKMPAKDMTRAEAQKRAEALFDKLDLNHDGKLDAADRKLMRDTMRTRRFDKLDTNHDGMISRAEFMADKGPEEDGKPRHGKHRHGMRNHGPWGMMRMADSNKDRAISKQEFVAAALKRFDLADTNHDGIVTVAERKAAFEKMRMERKDHHRGAMGQQTPTQ